MLRLCYALKSLPARHRNLSVWWSLNMLRAGCCDEQFKAFKTFKQFKSLNEFSRIGNF
jgi:hypothetical protein